MQNWLKRILPVLFLPALLLSSSFQEPRTGYQVGDQIPELKINGVNGKPVLLSSLKGKMVLIDFWASWCGPCRLENPNLVVAYNKFRNTAFKTADGFEIFSISLDNQKEKWIEAIKKDNLYWPNHVSELMYWNDKTSKLFGFNMLPFNVLIDGNGQILAKNLIGRVPDENGRPSGISRLEAELNKHLK